MMTGSLEQALRKDSTSRFITQSAVPIKEEGTSRRISKIITDPFAMVRGYSARGFSACCVALILFRGTIQDFPACCHALWLVSGKVLGFSTRCPAISLINLSDKGGNKMKIFEKGCVR
jgi:hypothetical protein